MSGARRQLDLFGGDGGPAAEDAGDAAVVLDVRPELPDAGARDAIATMLDANVLVEAGAGAGKTRAMVGRMVAHVLAGVPIERLAAVTFTRKAAAELRERLQTALEHALATARTAGDDERRALLDAGLRGIDRGFTGTIHAFCARLLRERAIDAGIDPGFREMFGPEEARQRRTFWTTHAERLMAAGDPRLEALRRVGLSYDQLYAMYDKLCENEDVLFDAEPVEAPDPGAARAELEALLERARRMMPRREHEKGWDDLQRTVRALAFHQDVLGWSSPIAFLRSLSEQLATPPKVTQYKWVSDDVSGKDAKALGEAFAAFVTDGTGGRTLRQWWAHRYPIALEYARHAADCYAAERRADARLSFQDLLVLTARMLRTSAISRKELGERYRHLLVDEFQDTDPVQAEVLMLLASDPDEGDDWRSATPRPGALFVVGDPKQSIYRFRRADIALYAQVKDRFAAFGEVLELTANFRSTPPIEAFVNDVFEPLFATGDAATQAPFAPMRVQRQSASIEGVYWYDASDLPDEGGQTPVEREAEFLASWIHDRVERGERQPGDFLLLTWTKTRLAHFARALEARNLPVEVTGAGVTLEDELIELRLLLQALTDPGDPSLTVAVLVGLFFGLDYEQLAAHRVDVAGRFDFVRPPPDPATEVEHALVELNALWRIGREESADLALPRIVERLGLLPYAASGSLGESRAGALAFVIEAVRAAALNGEASLDDALAAIDVALDPDNTEVEAPLEPGRSDVIRVMNLHKAKGLEAPVVLLVDPAPPRAWTDEVHIDRPREGVARGWLLATQPKGRYATEVLARPLDWDVHERTAVAFRAAEQERLRYVAATRAMEELVVALEKDRSPWAPFADWLRDRGDRLSAAVRPRPERRTVEATAEALRAEVVRVDTERRRLALPTYRAAAVTARVKAVDAGAPPAPSATEPDALPRGIDVARADAQERSAARGEGRGTEWGSAVHGALESAGRGASGDTLRQTCRTLLLAAERPTDDGGEPIELDELLDIVATVRASPLWQRAESARASGRLVVEVPFAIGLSAAEYGAIDGDAAGADEAAAVEIVEGVIDLAFDDGDGWIIADYKSDAAGPDVAPEVLARYRAQVDLYAAAWKRLTGETVAERKILFTATGDLVAW